MENRIELPTDQFQELARRISKAKTPEEFLDALDKVSVYLAAQRETTTAFDVIALRDVVHRSATRPQH